MIDKGVVERGVMPQADVFHLALKILKLAESTLPECHARPSQGGVSGGDDRGPCGHQTDPARAGGPDGVPEASGENHGPGRLSPEAGPLPQDLKTRAHGRLCELELTHVLRKEENLILDGERTIAFKPSAWGNCLQV